MADTVRISYSTTNIDFAPQAGFVSPDALEKVNHISADGTMYSYTFYYKRRWSVPIRFMDSTDSANINSWWENGYAVSFYPDMVNAPGTSFSCRIVNTTKPLTAQPLGYWQTYFEGEVELQEI